MIAVLRIVHFLAVADARRADGPSRADAAPAHNQCAFDFLEIHDQTDAAARCAQGQLLFAPVHIVMLSKLRQFPSGGIPQKRWLRDGSRFDPSERLACYSVQSIF